VLLPRALPFTLPPSSPSFLRGFLPNIVGYTAYSSPTSLLLYYLSSLPSSSGVAAPLPRNPHDTGWYALNPLTMEFEFSSSLLIFASLLTIVAFLLSSTVSPRRAAGEPHAGRRWPASVRTASFALVLPLLVFGFRGIFVGFPVSVLGFITTYLSK
jgi:hypothetical protein